MTPPSTRFPEEVVALFDRASYLYLKAGTERHRPIALWMVVVEQRVFVRSWSASHQGWHRTLMREPRAIIRVAKCRLRARAVRTRGERLKRLVSRAYLRKYAASSLRRYAVDLGRPLSTATTTELVPFNDP